MTAWAKAFADFTQIYHQIAAMPQESETMTTDAASTPVAIAARTYFAARYAHDKSPEAKDPEDEAARFRELVRIEKLFLRMPSQSARDVMLKAWNLIEFFENEGSTPEIFAKEVHAFIAADAERDLIDPPDERERREIQKNAHRRPDVARAGTGLASEIES